MEQWEIDLREKLNKEIPEGTAIIEVGGWTTYMGKQGRIEFDVAIMKEIKRLNIIIEE